MFVFAVVVCACGSLFDGFACNWAVVRVFAIIAFGAGACFEVWACVACYVVYIVAPFALISMWALFLECVVDASDVSLFGWGWLLDSVNYERIMYEFAIRVVATT